jgi:hypothetical protein
MLITIRDPGPVHSMEIASAGKQGDLAYKIWDT